MPVKTTAIRNYTNFGCMASSSRITTMITILVNSPKVGKRKGPSQRNWCFLFFLYVSFFFLDCSQIALNRDLGPPIHSFIHSFIRSPTRSPICFIFRVYFSTFPVVIFWLVSLCRMLAFLGRFQSMCVCIFFALPAHAN